MQCSSALCPPLHSMADVHPQHAVHRALAQMYTGHMQREFVPPDADAEANGPAPPGTREYLKQVSSRGRPSIAS